jgi:hypothetical protein
MLFMLFLILLHRFMIADGPVLAAVRDAIDAALHDYLPNFVSAKNVAFWATGFVMIWFWLHIRPEQQNKISLATRLAEYDATPKSANTRTIHPDVSA